MMKDVTDVVKHWTCDDWDKFEFELGFDDKSFETQAHHPFSFKIPFNLNDLFYQVELSDGQPNIESVERGTALDNFMVRNATGSLSVQGIVSVEYDPPGKEGYESGSCLDYLHINLTFSDESDWMLFKTMYAA